MVFGAAQALLLCTTGSRAKREGLKPVAVEAGFLCGALTNQPHKGYPLFCVLLESMPLQILLAEAYRYLVFYELTSARAVKMGVRAPVRMYIQPLG